MLPTLFFTPGPDFSLGGPVHWRSFGPALERKKISKYSLPIG